jgi:hypothetical protein
VVLPDLTSLVEDRDGEPGVRPAMSGGPEHDVDVVALRMKGLTVLRIGDERAGCRRWQVVPESRSVDVCVDVGNESGQPPVGLRDAVRQVCAQPYAVTVGTRSATDQTHPVGL